VIPLLFGRLIVLFTTKTRLVLYSASNAMRWMTRLGSQVQETLTICAGSPLFRR